MRTPSGAVLDARHRRRSAAAGRRDRAPGPRPANAWSRARKYCSSDTSLVMRRSLSIRCHSGSWSSAWHHRPSIIERNAALASAASFWPVEPCGDGQSGDGRIVGLDRVHALADRHRPGIGPLGLVVGHRGLRDEVAVDMASRPASCRAAATSAISSGMSSHRNWPPVSSRSPSPLQHASTRPPTRSRASSSTNVDAGCLAAQAPPAGR